MDTHLDKVALARKFHLPLQQNNTSLSRKFNDSPFILTNELVKVNPVTKSFCQISDKSKKGLAKAGLLKPTDPGAASVLFLLNKYTAAEKKANAKKQEIIAEVLKWVAVIEDDGAQKCLSDFIQVVNVQARQSEDLLRSMGTLTTILKQIGKREHIMRKQIKSFNSMICDLNFLEKEGKSYAAGLKADDISSLEVTIKAGKEQYINSINTSLNYELSQLILYSFESNNKLGVIMAKYQEESQRNFFGHEEELEKFRIKVIEEKESQPSHLQQLKARRRVPSEALAPLVSTKKHTMMANNLRNRDYTPRVGNSKIVGGLQQNKATLKRDSHFYTSNGAKDFNESSIGFDESSQIHSNRSGLKGEERDENYDYESTRFGFNVPSTIEMDIKNLKLSTKHPVRKDDTDETINALKPLDPNLKANQRHAQHVSLHSMEPVENDMLTENSWANFRP